MTFEEFNDFCRGLPATTYVCQWGGSDVWKVGGKVFAIGSRRWADPAFTFKATDLAFRILPEEFPGVRPAPYMASRGLKWLQQYAEDGLDDAALKDYLRQSYRLVASGLSKKRQRALGLADWLAADESL